MIARALTVAGSDPTGGAGIQQDLKTFQALGVWGLSAITAVTVQDTAGVRGWHAIPPETVVAQIAAVVTDVGVDAAKTGMMPDAATVERVAAAFDRFGVGALVVDPIMAATSGDPLADADAVAAMRTHLVPAALLVTPNVHEAHRLTGIAVESREDQIEAARALRDLGARAALVTGGHLPGGSVVDLLVTAEGEVHELTGRRVGTGPVHGSGCALSAAITASLAKGSSLLDACHTAKRHTSRAIERAATIGRGARVVDPCLTQEARPDPAAG